MTTRRGIFFNSKSRSADSNLIFDEKNRSSPPKTEPSNIITNDDPTSGSSSNNSQTSPPKTTTISTGIVKKKLILKNTKRTLTKTIYSGPRKIFSTSYKVSLRIYQRKKYFFFGNFLG
jgi:hypothetical protein